MGQLAMVSWHSREEDEYFIYRLSVSLLLSTGVLGFGLTCWEEGCCSLYIPLVSVPQLQRMDILLDGTGDWNRISSHPLLYALAR